jgi:hypothetical protein
MLEQRPAGAIGFIGAPPGAALFTTTPTQGHAIGRVQAGLQLLGVGNLDLRMQYDGELGGVGVSNAGLLTAVWRF